MTSEAVLPPPAQRVVPVFEAIARHVGASTGRDVLDFGAGAGRHVAEFRAAGYNALGVDQQHVSHEVGQVEPEFLHRVAPPAYVLPFPDGSFDFVFSTSVMEHVLDPGGALSEIARVLRPGGWSAHVFPARWRPIEPHIFVPFGGRLQSYLWMRLWATLGVRNGWQAGLGGQEAALRNTQYAKTGISYPTAREWLLRGEAQFEKVSWAERPYIEATSPISRLSRAIRPFARIPGVTGLYRGFHTRVLVLR